MENASGKKRRMVVRLLVVAACVAAFFAVLLLSLPFVVAHVPLPDLEFDLAPYLEGAASGIAAEKKATARLEIVRGDPDGFLVRANGRILGWPYSAKAYVRFSWWRADGDASISLDGTDWRMSANFGGTSPKDWRFSASVRETRFAQDDAVLGAVLAGLNPQVASNLVFSGTFSLDAEGESTKEVPVPVWSARGNLKDVSVSFPAEGAGIEVRNFRTRFGASGIAGHLDISPLFPKADCVEVGGVTLSNVFASVRATERSYLVTEAGAECCGGEVRLYSLFLDPERLSAGATVFVDGVDAGAVLGHVSAFRGVASGRLHGKLPFFLEDGRRLSFKNAYLFSSPGETGKIRVTDTRPIVDSLLASGVQEDDCANLSMALANLDYRVLRIELVPGEGGGVSALTLKLNGTGKVFGQSVPVNLDVTFRGDIETLVNTGLDISRRR